MSNKIHIGQGIMIGDDVIHIVIPCTPSRNEIDKWHRSRNYRIFKRHSIDANVAIIAALRMAFKGTYPVTPNWSDRVIICAIRCSKQRKRIDTSNLLGGLKIVEDVIVNTGFIRDDGPKYVDWGPVQDRIESMWGNMFGPATHLYLCKHSMYNVCTSIAPVLDIMGITHELTRLF